MVFKARPRRAENTRHLVKIPILRSVYGSKDTPKLDQFFKLKHRRCFDVLGIEIRDFFHIGRTVESPGWLYPEAQSAAWRSYITVI